MLTSLLLCGCSGYGGVLIPEREGRGRDRNIVRKMGKGRKEEVLYRFVCLVHVLWKER